MAGKPVVTAHDPAVISQFAAMAEAEEDPYKVYIWREVMALRQSM